MPSYKTLGGDRTHNLPVRSRTPYPFGHEGGLAEDSFDLSTFGLWAQRASSAPLCFKVFGLLLSEYLVVYSGIEPE